MTTHRVRRRPITRSDGETFEPGDEIEPTEDELEAFGDNLAPNEDDEAEADESAGGEEAEQAQLATGEAEADLEAVLDGTVDEVQAALATGEYDDVLDELGGLETDAEARKGVFEALDERRAAEENA